MSSGKAFICAIVLVPVLLFCVLLMPLFRLAGKLSEDDGF